LSSVAYDVVIVGSGIVGATTALALARQSQLKIALLEAGSFPTEWRSDTHDHRVSAISLASKNIFQNLKVWESIVQKRISPYTHMHVWDSDEHAEIQFAAADVNENALGFIIEDAVMRASVLEELKRYQNVEFIFSQKLKSIHRPPAATEIELTLEAGAHEKVMTKLLIAADGANSLVRDLAGIELTAWDYEHTALVAAVQTELPHQRTARQRFIATGPLAFLPLEDANTCSIVWSTSHEHAKELLALSGEEFCLVLQKAFKHKLGVIKAVDKRYAFPLRMRHAKNYVQSNLALIGDAAHTIHPLAGQGVNLGLLDAVCLAEVILDAAKKNRDFSSHATLRRYERWRKSDNLTMLAGVEVLKRLFASDYASVQSMRHMGLTLTNRTQAIKNFFANYALGFRGDLPGIAK
jgi:2-octaprenylphenol hydroxylase